MEPLLVDIKQYLSDDELETLLARNTTEYFIWGGIGSRRVEVTVKIWEVKEGVYHLAAFWDAEHFSEGLGTPTTIVATPTIPGLYPKSVYQEIANFLCMGLDIMTEQGIRVYCNQRKEALNFMRIYYPHDN